MQGDNLKLLARKVQAIDSAIAGVASAGLRVFISDESAFSTVAGVLERGGPGARGPVNLVLSHPDLPGEVEIMLKGDYSVSPQIKGAIRSAKGVVMVEEF